MLPSADRFASSAVMPPRSMRILLVEDQQDVAASLEMFLRVEGYGVQVAPDGLAALEISQADPPDVVLLDIGLPGMDGFEVARRLCMQHRGKRPLLVAITGHGTADDQRCSRDAGIDYHFVKPVNVEALKGLLTRFQEFILPTYE